MNHGLTFCGQCRIRATMKPSKLKETPKEKKYNFMDNMTITQPSFIHSPEGAELERATVEPQIESLAQQLDRLTIESHALDIAPPNENYTNYERRNARLRELGRDMENLRRLLDQQNLDPQPAGLENQLLIDFRNNYAGTYYDFNNTLIHEIEPRFEIRRVDDSNGTYKLYYRINGSVQCIVTNDMYNNSLITNNSDPTRDLELRGLIL